MTIKKVPYFKTGEIWWVKLSIKSDDTIGHETQKTRPCIVIASCPEARMITVVPFQSNLDTVKLPYTHLIRKTQKNKLKNDSVAVIFQMRSLDYNRFLNLIGIIESKVFEKIKVLIRDFLNL